MAYSDYGAYIWKNGKNITNECADVSCKIIEGKFVFKNWYDNLVDEINKNENEKEKTISGHALINLEKFCISFYKTYNPILYYPNGEYKEVDIRKKFDYSMRKERLYIRGYELGYHTGFYFYEIDYKEDKYCVVIGNAIGKGWDTTPASKYILKHLVLFEREDGSSIYRIETKRDIDWDIVFNKLDRLEDINVEKYWLKEYKKQLCKDLFKLRFKKLAWNLNEILEHKERIKWLK